MSITIIANSFTAAAEYGKDNGARLPAIRHVCHPYQLTGINGADVHVLPCARHLRNHDNLMAAAKLRGANLIYVE